MKIGICIALISLFLVDLAHAVDHQEYDRTAAKISNDFLTLARKRGKDAQLALNTSLAILWPDDSGWNEWRRTQGKARRRAFRNACKKLKSGDTWMHNITIHNTLQEWKRDLHVLAPGAADRPPQCGDREQWAVWSELVGGELEETEVTEHATSLEWMDKDTRVALTLHLVDVVRWKRGAKARNALTNALAILWTVPEDESGGNGFSGGWKAWRGMAGNSSRHNFVESCSKLGGRWMDAQTIARVRRGPSEGVECTHFADHDDYYAHSQEHPGDAPPRCEKE